MTRFAHVLRRAESTLRTPEPGRTRVLMELAQDLEDLFAELRAGGLTEEEAAGRAEELLAPSPEALEALGRVHAPLHVRLAERYSEGSGHQVERWLLTGATVLSLLFAGYVLLAASSLSPSSPGSWLGAVGVLGALLALAAWHGAAVLLPSGRGGMPWHMTMLLWLAGLAGAVGLAGATVEVWRLAQVAQSGAGVPELFGYIGRAAEVMIFALMLMLATLLVWFAAYRRMRRASALLQEIHRKEIRR